MSVSVCDCLFRQLTNIRLLRKTFIFETLFRAYYIGIDSPTSPLDVSFYSFSQGSLRLKHWYFESFRNNAYKTWDWAFVADLITRTCGLKNELFVLVYKERIQSSLYWLWLWSWFFCNQKLELRSFRLPSANSWYFIIIIIIYSLLTSIESNEVMDWFSESLEMLKRGSKERDRENKLEERKIKSLFTCLINLIQFCFVVYQFPFQLLKVRVTILLG